MAIKAVVLDIGSVLEITDDSVFPGPWEQRLGLGNGGFTEAVSGLVGNPVTGEVTGQQMAAHWQTTLQREVGLACGWHGVPHRERDPTPTIEAVEQVIAEQHGTLA